MYLGVKRGGNSSCKRKYARAIYIATHSEGKPNIETLPSWNKAQAIYLTKFQSLTLESF
jgi:hypothetical protein